MATKRWTWEAKFNLDADAGETRHATFLLDGHEYEAIITPASPLRQFREAADGRRGLSGPVEKTSMSLGPRPGRCECCHR